MPEPDRIPRGKAAALVALSGQLRCARIPACSVVNLRDWQTDPVGVVVKVLVAMPSGVLAVRSARSDEDSRLADAGRYLSLLGIAANPTSLADAIQRVFDSYGPSCAGDQVLIQPQISDITHAIVASTRGAFGSAYDAFSHASVDAPDAITRGDCEADTWHVLPGSDVCGLPRPVAKALRLLDELRPKFDPVPFEVELLESRDELWLLQIRPLPGSSPAPHIEGTVQRGCRQLSEAHLEGATLLGMMPDWNPAELLGAHPRPFALSVFRYVIGDGTWWRARTKLGYAKPYTDQLLSPVAGRPYVNVRASFESLCPQELPARERKRLCDAWLARLRGNPRLHDRIEFDVVLGGYEFDAERRLEALDCGVSGPSLIPLLRAITASALDSRKLRAQINYFTNILSARTSSQGALQERILQLKQAIAEPFALAARCDFLAQALWKSASRLGAVSPSRCLEVLATPQESMGQASMSDHRDARPGQFDIQSVAHRLARNFTQPSEPPRLARFDAHELDGLAELLAGTSLPWTPHELVEATFLAARARELGKRTLAALLGDWFEQTRASAVTRGLDANVLSWLPWEIAIDVDMDPVEAHEHSMQLQQQHADEALLEMPMLLEDENDLRVVHLPASSGHFQGAGTVEGQAIRLDECSAPEMLPLHSIVAIVSADPGYEWVFSRQPVALVTAYGGPHSHMALRCADAGCGSVLGLGMERFGRLVAGSKLHIDFDHMQIQRLS